MQTPAKVRNRMRLLATQRGHLHSDFSNLRLMDEICPIVYFLRGKNLSALQKSQFAKLTIRNWLPSALIKPCPPPAKINQWGAATQSHNRTIENLIKRFPNSREIKRRNTLRRSTDKASVRLSSRLRELSSHYLHLFRAMNLAIV